jgi:hypothetical protein
MSGADLSKEFAKNQLLASQNDRELRITNDQANMMIVSPMSNLMASGSIMTRRGGGIKGISNYVRLLGVKTAALELKLINSLRSYNIAKAGSVDHIRPVSLI